MTTRRPDAPTNTMHDDDAPPASGLSSMQRAILTIQKMRTKIEHLERARIEPIAIIGMGCRFPGGAGTPEAFFKLLEDGVDAIREVPAERWRIEQAETDGEGENPALQWGSFLDEVDRFDAGFFGISPREAESLDPQQRLLLEVAWEALERAGQLPERLMGSRTGVFVGVWALDYQQRVLALSPEKLDAYCFTGNVLSTAAGRISYSFGLQGPCITVETACSSSLTAIHLACQSLRNGESNLALAGGVNLMLSPATTKLLSKTQALSPDGRCKAFDSRANGFVRGEGCGILVLKRLSDAERDGDSIIALIRGSAVNQDGRSTGLTAPNVLSQQALLKQALENARVAPSDIGYVEAHGTGTSLGDPIEVEALKAVLGAPREKGSVCVLGAVKTNIGHLEAAAGVAGVIKVALSLQNEKIPGNLHFRALNPRIDLKGTSLEIAQGEVPWKSGLRPRFAGASSFGISGTNAHVVLEEAPRNLEEAIFKESSAYLLPISAKTPEALADHVRAYQKMLSAPESPRLLDVIYTASSRRSHFEHRLSAVGGSKEELAGALDAYLRGEAPAGVASGKATPARAKVVFVFSGQGSQWAGMGKKLYDEESAFRSVIDSCDALLMGRLGWSLLDELDAPESSSRIGETQVAQPLIFAIQIALVELLRSWGIAPDAVIGHSVGEIAAAYIAGILSLDEAIRLVAIRGRIMQKATGLGKMVSVAAPASEARKAIAGYEDRLSVAAVNDPGSVVLAGDTSAMDEVLTKLERDGVVCRPLRVNYAFHSPQMDPLAAELVERLVRVDARRATLAMYSTVLSECVEGKELDVRYWGRNVRETVNLSGAVDAAVHDGYQLFLEVGPHPVLTSNVQQCLAARQTDGLAAYTLRRNQDDRRALLGATGALYTRGCAVEWARVVPSGGRVVPLPTYPWRKQRYWIDDVPAGAVMPSAASLHPVLGVPFALSLDPTAHYWERAIAADNPAWVSDHVVQGEVVFPGAGYVEMAIAAGIEVLGDVPLVLEELAFERMLSISATNARFVQIVLTAEGASSVVHVSSRASSGDPWVLHATCRLARASGAAAARAEAPSLVEARCGTEVSADEHYARLEERGLAYGKHFRGVRVVRLGTGEATARVVLPFDPRSADRLHPALLDACFQVAGLLAVSSAKPGAIVPVRVARLVVRGPVPKSVWVHARISEAAGSSRDVLVDLTLCDDDGQPVVSVEGLAIRRMEAIRGGAGASLDGCVYDVKWRPAALVEAPAPAAARGGTWLVLADAGGASAALVQALRARGETCVVAVPGERFEKLEPGLYRFDPRRAEDVGRVAHEAFGNAAVCRGAIHLLGLDAAPWARASAESIEADERRALGSALSLAQALLRLGGRDVPRLVFVTRGACHVGGEALPTSVSQAPLWGLARTIGLEAPELECTCIDLASVASTSDAESLARELLSSDGELQVAYREEGRFVARLAASSFDAGAEEEDLPLVPAAGRPFRLDVTRPGVLERLALRELSRRVPSDGEVEVEVEASALNFLDVLLAMGVLPDDARDSKVGALRLGIECAGRVVAAGPGVDPALVGQEVIAMGLGAMGTHLVTSHHLVAKKPSRMRWEDAASLPVVFLTAYHALCKVARLAKGERVLIHAGAGGVGMAAIQWARHVGAEIFATAGSEEKRALLESLGVHHVMDSRSRAFVGDVLRITHGEGVDVVLNSLSGELIEASFGLLRDYGRFVEIGKRDYYEDRPLGLRPFLKNLSYTLVDLRGMMLQRPEVVASLFSEVLALFESGVFTPLPLRTYPVSRAVEGFTLMAQAKHTGKIAFSMRDPDARIRLRSNSAAAGVRADATYLVTGGLGGLGLSIAAFLVARGARHLVLVGRSAPSESASSVIREMEGSGTHVRVARADVSRLEDVRALLADIGASMPPLGGVVHAAGVIDDHTLLELDAERLARVFAPKALGAWNLHEATRDTPLDFFVMYSSVASLLGSPGQANYAAANAFLDALGHARRLSGVPATSVQWGPFSEVGMAAALEKRGSRLARHGLESFSPAEGNQAFERILSNPRPVVAVVRLSPRQWLESNPQAATQPFWSDLRKESAASKGVASFGFRDELERAPREQRSALVLEHVLAQLARVIRTEASRIDSHASFTNLGIDSLMSIELRNRLESTLGLKLPATLLFTYANPAALAEHLLRELHPKPAADAQPLPEPSRVESAPEAPSPSPAASAIADDDLLAAFDASVRELGPEK